MGRRLQVEDPKIRSGILERRGWPNGGLRPPFLAGGEIENTNV
jgi:hypothetical protein